MKKSLILLLFVAITASLRAYDFKVDGICYNIITDQPNAVKVTYEVYNNQSNYASLTTANIPGSITYQGTTYSVTSIGDSAFYKCSNLTSVTIPNSVTSIGKYAFYDCSSLTSVAIPNNVTSIGNFAFNSCIGLNSVIIPNSVTSIGTGAFIGCRGITSIEVAAENTVYDSRDNCNAIIKTATNSLIAGCQITTIPNSVTTIGINAFKDCSSLLYVTIPNSVTSIGNYAFYNCDGLTSVTIPNSVTSIGDDAFSGCSSMTSVTIGNSVTSIGRSAFSSCRRVSSVTIPNNVTSIGSHAFSACSGLISMTVEAGNTVYDSRNNCNAIIETATNTLIAGCQNTTIPNSVTSIGDDAFNFCSSLTSITIPNSVTSIGNNAFYYCSSLTSIAIPDSVTSIGNDAFYRCNSLTAVTIPESLTSFGDYAFFECVSLISVTIPNSVTSIGKKAFSRCTGLNSITCEAVTPPTLGSSVFESVDTSIPLYVPAESIALYQAAEQWQDFTNIQAIGSQEIVTPQICHRYGRLLVSGSNGMTVKVKNMDDSATPIADTNISSDYQEIDLSVLEVGQYKVEWNSQTFLIDFVGGSGSPVSPSYSEEGCSDSANTPLWASMMEGDSYLFGCNMLIGLSAADNPYVFYDSLHNCCGADSVIVLTLMVNAPANPSGTCGDNLTWEFNPADSTLTIHGSGAMDNWTSTTMPWYYYLAGIKTVSIDGASSIGNSAFQGCSSLVSVYMPQGLNSIGNSSFYDCTALVSIDIPDGVNSIGGSAFYQCTGLTSVSIPGSVTSIGDRAFFGCDALPVTDNARYADTYLVGAVDTTITACVIQPNTRWIGNASFRDCSHLTSIVIPDSVERIFETAFQGCSSMESLTIGSNVSALGSFCFSNCTGLTAITCKAVTPPTFGTLAFNGVDNSIPLYVPAESVELYQAANGWSAFTNIQAISTDDEEEVQAVQSIASATGNFIRWIGTAETLTADKTLAYLEITEEQGQTLTIAGGAKLTIGQCVLGAYAEVVVNPGGALIINDSIVTAEESNLVLKSDINQTGIFVMGPDVTNNRQPNALVQFTPDIYISADGTYHWQTFAIPVTQVESVTKNPNSSTYVSLWDAANATWVMMSNWSELLPFHAAKITNMVAESSTDRVTYSFMGNLLGNVTDDLVWQNTGWNLLGNSFTAPMSTVSLLNDLAGQDAEATVWLIDPNDGSYKAVNAAMSAFTIPDNRLTIPAMTGFVLNNTGTGEGAITIDYANTVYNYALNPTDAQYSLPSNQDNTITAKAKITISCSSGEQDELYLLEGSNYSSQYESGADISKLMNQGINLYAVSGNDNLYMVATNDLTNTPLTFRSNTSETAYTMTFSDVAGTVILYDAVTGSEILLANGGTYDFMCAADMMVSDRFYINQVYTAPMICHRNGTLQVSGSNGLTVRVRDQDGSATVIGDVYITSNYQEIDLSALSEGVYKVEWNSQIFNIYVEGWSPSVYTYIPEGGCTKSDDTNIAVTLLEGEDFLFGCTYLSGLTVGAHVYRDSLSNICGSDSVIVLTMMVYANLTPSGTCGDSLTWVFNTIDSTLTLTGSGAMTNFSDESLVPWVEYKADIVTLLLPEALTTIGSFAFAYCTGLTEVTIPNSVTTIGRDAFNNCNSLTSVTIPNNVTILDDYTFADCTGLTEVTIGNSVTSIRDGVFQYCSSLTSVTIPNSVTSMGEGVFDHCSGLTSITCEAVTPPTLGSNVFYNVSTSIPLYVPGSSIALYQAAEQWSDFTNIHAICDTVYEFSETFNLCGADNFTWHDKVYTASGTYVDTLLSVEGCDSIVTLELNFLPTYLYADSITIYDGTRYYWRGRDLAEAGTYYDSLQSVSGCDSVYMLTLSIGKCVIEIDTTILVCYDELPYEHNGIQYWDRDSTFTDTLLSIDACDTIYRTKFVRTVKCNEYHYGKYCDNDYPVIGNDTIKTSCMYHQQVWTSSGLDSVFRYKIEINPTYEDSIPDTVYICQGDTFVWYYSDYTQSGQYSYTLLSQDGCDSIVKLELIVGQVYHFTETVSLCDGESYTWHGLNLTTSGIYYDSLVSSTGCDSIYQLNLIVHQSYYFEEDVSTCQGTAYLWHGRRYSVSGIYYDSLQTVSGCDSIYQLRLTVNPTYTISESDTICEGETYQWHGRTFKRTGTYYDFLKTINGCDSIYTLHLTVNPTYLIEDIVSVREDKLPYMWQGEAINQSGDYRKEYTASTGCDSVHTLHFTVTALPIYTVNVLADHGHVNGTGTYPEGTRITLTAVPDEGFEFQMWSDGTTTNPKNFTVLQDTTFRALFYMPEVEQEVTVDSIETNSVTITWDTVPGAVLYELSIYKNGQLVVIYQVDPDNNILNEVFNGPDRLIARKDSTGGSSETLQVEVGGLEPGQDYTYSLDALDEDRSYVGAQSGSFTTEEEPVDGLDILFDDRRTAPRKVLRDGNLYIMLPDGTIYDARGQSL